MKTTRRKLALLAVGGMFAVRFPGLRKAEAISAQEYCPSAQELEVFRQLNAFRAENGQSPLRFSGTLGAAARHHANDMAARGYFSHDGQDGSTPSTRAAAHGYTGRSIGENIAKGQRSESAVMTAWKNSSGHRTNMLRSSYQAVGIGYDPNGNHWVQVFGGSFDVEPACGAPNPGPGPNPNPNPSPTPTPRPNPRPNPRPSPTPKPNPQPNPRPNPRPSPAPQPGPAPAPNPAPNPNPGQPNAPKPKPSPKQQCKGKTGTARKRCIRNHRRLRAKSRGK